MSELDLVSEEVSMIELSEEEDTIMDIQNDEEVPNMSEDRSITMNSPSLSVNHVIEKKTEKR